MFVTFVVLGPLVRHSQADAVVAQLLSVARSGNKLRLHIKIASSKPAVM